MGETAAEHAAAPEHVPRKKCPMPSVFVISREPRTRDSVHVYLSAKGYETRIAHDYGQAIDLLEGELPQALVVDVQGLPRDEVGVTFAGFNTWLSGHYPDSAPAMVYLLHKGARRPHFRIDGTVIKKPFPIEALGKAVRERIGLARVDGEAPPIELDLATNTLKTASGETHLTNIEATLLAYLMEHSGEILHPRNLLVDVWQYRDTAGASTLVRAHVSNLRRKLRDAQGDATAIQTIRGKGYRFVA